MPILSGRTHVDAVVWQDLREQIDALQDNVQKLKRAVRVYAKRLKANEGQLFFTPAFFLDITSWHALRTWWYAATPLIVCRGKAFTWNSGGVITFLWIHSGQTPSVIHVETDLLRTSLQKMKKADSTAERVLQKMWKQASSIIGWRWRQQHKEDKLEYCLFIHVPLMWHLNHRFRQLQLSIYPWCTKVWMVGYLGTSLFTASHCPASDIFVPLIKIYCTYHVTDSERTAAGLLPLLVWPHGTVSRTLSAIRTPPSCFQAPAKDSFVRMVLAHQMHYNDNVLYISTHWHWHWPLFFSNLTSGLWLLLALEQQMHCWQQCTS